MIGVSETVMLFLEDLGRKGYSSRTIAGYRCDLGVLAQYLDEVYSIRELDLVREEHLKAFLRFASDTLGNSGHAVARKLYCLKSFFNHSWRNGLVAENPSLYLEPAPLPPERSWLPLSLEEIRKLVKAVDGPQRSRDLCLISLLLVAGLRLSETCSLKRSDIDLEGGRIRSRKSNPPSWASLPEEVIAALRTVTSWQGAGEPDRPLFISSRGEAIGPRAVQKMLHKRSRQAGLRRRVTAERLRRTYSLFFQAASSLNLLSEVLPGAHEPPA